MSKFIGMLVTFFIGSSMSLEFECTWSFIWFLKNQPAEVIQVYGFTGIMPLKCTADVLAIKHKVNVFCLQCRPGLLVPSPLPPHPWSTTGPAMSAA